MRAMKNSGIEWIGEIPESWGVSKLKYFVDCYDGKRVPIDSAKRQTGSYPYWGAGSITDYVNDYIFDEELVLLGEDGAPFFDYTRPVAFLVNEKIWVNNHIHVLKVHENMNSNYIVRFLNSVDFKSYINGSILNKLTQSNMNEIAMLYPSLSEQHRIADYLDDKCSKIDNIIEKQQQVIEKLKEYKLSVITEAVTKGLDPDAEMKDSGVEWIGMIPEKWNVYRIGALYSERKEQGSDELPILTVSINTGVSDRELADDETSRIFVRSEDKSKYMRVYPGDLTYNMMRAWQGAFGAVRVDGMVSPAYVIAKPKREIDSRYMEALLRTPSAKEEMKRYSHGIADFRLRLYWEKFKYLKICFPPIEEQKAIADYLDKKCLAIETAISKKQAIIDKLAEYKKSLVYEVVTGKKEV